MNHHIFLEATEEGKALNLTFEQEHTCKVVYKPAKDGKGYIFSELWDVRPQASYPDDHIIVPVRSVYAGKFLYREDDIFANIIGSKSDHCPASSWIQLLINHSINCSQCVMDNTFYDSRDRNGNTYFKDNQCGGGIKGGTEIKLKGYLPSPISDMTVLLPERSFFHGQC